MDQTFDLSLVDPIWVGIQKLGSLISSFRFLQKLILLDCSRDIRIVYLYTQVYLPWPTLYSGTLLLMPENLLAHRMPYKTIDGMWGQCFNTNEGKKNKKKNNCDWPDANQGDCQSVWRRKQDTSEQMKPEIANHSSSCQANKLHYLIVNHILRKLHLEAMRPPYPLWEEILE